MASLKISSIDDNRPVKLSIELPAEVYRSLLAYADLLRKESGGAALEPARLISPMIQRFMATDREFKKRRRSGEALARTAEQGSSGA